MDAGEQVNQRDLLTKPVKLNSLKKAERYMNSRNSSNLELAP